MPPNALRLALLTGSSLPMILALGASQASGRPAKAVVSGEVAYAKSCAPCHGAGGKGGPGYAKPLVGSLSVDGLARFVSRSMPPGRGTPLPAAQAIAAYAHGAFYSPLAQERNRPARVALSRLTAGQFRNAVADLVGGFHSTLPGTPGGLRGEYFKGRDFDGKARLIERTDPGVAFDFGKEAPQKEGFDPRNFSVAWSGSLLAPDGGEYEIVVQSDQAVRLWFNGAPKPLVDAWVRSGKETEFSAPVTLLGGRAYPLRLEFSKAGQGVNDDEKRKALTSPPAFVRLLWRRPRRVPETIPARDLVPNDSPRTYVVTTPFPPDDRSVGYERGVAVSKEWDDAVTAAALDAAGFLADHTGVPADAKDRVERLKGFARSFVERAFRRPLTPDVQALYVDRQFAVAATPEIAVKRVVLLALQSPRFLYRELGPNDPYAVAANLSFGLWDTLPDAELERAAASGELARPEGVARQATRLAGDPRAWTKLRAFLLLWLKVDDVPDIVKSAKRYPEFDAATAADLRTSLELYLEDAGWDYRKLMLSPRTFLNGRLSKLYGGGLSPDAPFQPVEGDRTGVLAQPYLLARYAYLDGSDPIHRGVLIVRNVLGRVLSPPPAAFAPLAASAHPEFTTRQRVAFQTRPTMCDNCHGLINPIGFTFEGFDAIGRARTLDNAKPVDSSGAYVGRDGKTVAFKGPKDLARFLAASDEAQSAFVERLFQNMVRQPALAYGPRTIPDLQRSFEKDGTNVRDLMVAIMLKTTERR